MLEVIAGIIVLLLAGALIGLIPYLIGRYTGKPALGKLALVCCTLSGVILMEVPVAIGFSIAAVVKKEDYHRPGSPRPAVQNPGPVRVAAPAAAGGMHLTCLSGPLRGQVYPVGTEGLMLGRDASCAVRFPDGTPGISGRHCCIRWQQGVPVLIDLGSTYGTFQGDGRQLPPNYPVQLGAGSRFYLASNSCLFQMTLQ